MGSGFFKGIDPIGQLVGSVAGKNSWFSKMAHYDPIMGSSVGKVISPATYDAGQAYGARRNVTPTPTPFAGVQPTLQDANNGYVQQSQRAANVNRPVGAGPQSIFQQGSY